MFNLKALELILNE